MLALALALLLSAPPAGAKDAKAPPVAGPTAAETAKLFFLAGDVQKAQEWAQRGLKREPKTCGPLNKLIAEYAFLLSHADEFTPEEAKRFFELDRTISPTVRGKLTEKAYEKYVKHPLELAKSRSKGDEAGARELLDKVLIADPANADAKALLASLGATDAGR
ncbi:MAG: hypothetical protein U0228_27990 [Myxococcaceae bacterium]